MCRVDVAIIIIWCKCRERCVILERSLQLQFYTPCQGLYDLFGWLTVPWLLNVVDLANDLIDLLVEVVGESLVVGFGL